MSTIFHFDFRYPFTLHHTFHALLILLCFNSIFCWTSDDLELFDLVEEVNGNFYDVLGIKQDATISEVKKAYRRLSLFYHPDRNKEPNAEEMFRKIASIMEVLKDEEKRRNYNMILIHGLPDWKQPIYYYRRVRKMSLLEMSIFLGVLFTLGHYIVAWSIYWERKYEMEEVLTARLRKSLKKNKKKQNLDCGTPTSSLVDENVLIPKPRYQDLLPIRLTCFLFYLIKSAPAYYQHWRETWLNPPKLEEPLPDPEPARVRKPRRRVRPELPDYTCIFQPVEAPNSGSSESEESPEPKAPEPQREEGDWSEADTLALIKAMNKFPGGTTNRWEKVANTLNRTEAQVLTMVKQLKSTNYAIKVPTSLQGITGAEVGAPPDCQASANTSREEWSQTQQVALEESIKKFPKGANERWDLIADNVPGKNKEDCILRYKYLVELVKKKKTQPC